MRRDRFIASANSEINESLSNFRISLMLPRNLQKRFFCTLESGKIFDTFFTELQSNMTEFWKRKDF